MDGNTAHDIPQLRRQLAPWAKTWELPGFEQRLEISFSSRLRSSLGRCVPRTREIRLAAFLREGPPALLQETLCHEAAHAAVYELHGAGRRPHGAEWRALMRAAGFEPRVRFPANLLSSALPQRARSEQLWEHRCPVCRASRVARRRVSAWRCAACRAAGQEGELVVTRLTEPRRGGLTP